MFPRQVKVDRNIVGDPLAVNTVIKRRLHDNHGRERGGSADGRKTSLVYRTMDGKARNTVYLSRADYILFSNRRLH